MRLHVWQRHRNLLGSHTCLHHGVYGVILQPPDAPSGSVSCRGEVGSLNRSPAAMSLSQPSRANVRYLNSTDI
ncbi:hypothetical protein F751_1658 [Auxenochlorella protothecoides]|uniref:Uncharacterized protein n=1 Tax=Auxenochlorella protothecoides TaxID=3075 RepID=A0A087SU78_AUXPR|nr:hypothetical protein F751_1658 [Auxenochlorella protothecoides]KFM29282.1 hypothetical protein F751_1658 [Auxenochlorella protothecoides]